MKKIALLLCIFFCASCSTGKVPAGVQTKRYIIRSETKDVRQQVIHFVPNESTEQIGDDSWITFVNDIEGFLVAYPADYPKERPVSFADMSIEEIEPYQPCSPTTLGVSTPKVIQNISAKILWGKVDFWERYSSGEGYLDYDGEPPNCRPATGENGAAYALCSEKDGKTVLICISQVSDNPGIATQIFDSFKWIK
ncbi:MAG: hypothetical protein KBD00_00700 [Candidatus Peribacteraceae bacterium]|nr:hypothetical protein [Candidatus Peribacteraceae bacterium]